VSRYVFKLPDLGEGTVEAEIVQWRVQPGDEVTEDDALVEMMTEKATVEVPAPVGGRVLSVRGGPGDRIAVGSELAVFETEKAQSAASTPPTPPGTGSAPATTSALAPPPGQKTPSSSPPATATPTARVLTSPAIRRRAHEAGIDLSQVSGSGPNGRIMRDDLAGHIDARVRQPATRPNATDGPATQEIKVIGLRRVIAERISESARTIPHFTYVEEVDVTELEALRVHLNRRPHAEGAPLTYLPFLMLALARVLPEHPECNALYDAERGVLVRHRAVHVGIATQTPDGLKVPVVRDVQSKSLHELAAEVRRVSEAARSNQATRAELTGSTITVTSLGKLGGIVSTPIINAPEVAIVGVNRAVERAVVVEGRIAIRRMMNLSSSFDHRFIDGHDAAGMIQALKERLEHPATIFVD
jgi:2-oxoisovalerate dehydrogenase E2 component (dihydrolipoyl transacylase)